ncbi:hypothetical protein [Paenibacillus aquistagni]|uniref:hypothetical protein n=1 Tax=Paenibacillus aquistagni TaxID=1852522 RepID=UPI00145B9208|nr:hypothetical protein [Paenibacillus aquistagni]NMM52053.1 hypothetical protein [Paenibacillus aquistagni]
MLIEFNRNKLYEEVWKEPATKIAKRYGVPYEFFRKACIELKVPLPSAGYWTQIKFGKNDEVPPLPDYTGADIISIEYKKPKPTTLHRMEKQLTALEQFCSTLSVPHSLKKPHPIIEFTLFSEKSNVSVGYNKRLVMKSSDKQKKRILLIMDTLFKSIERWGAEIRHLGDKSEICYNKEKLIIAIREKTKRVARIKSEKELLDEKIRGFSWERSYDFPFTGELILWLDSSATSRKEWKDTTAVKIESLIGDVVLRIFDTFEKLKQRTEERKKMEYEWRQEELERQRVREIREDEYKKVQELEKNAGDHKKAQEIREFIAHLKVYSERINDASELSKINDYIIWAEQKANWLDPLIAVVDPILGQKHSNLFEEQQNKKWDED